MIERMTKEELRVVVKEMKRRKENLVPVAQKLLQQPSHMLV